MIEVFVILWLWFGVIDGTDRPDCDPTRVDNPRGCNPVPCLIPLCNRSRIPERPKPPS